jgi:RNA polymerase sigma-70 factor (ECF subfamily)
MKKREDVRTRFMEDVFRHQGIIHKIARLYFDDPTEREDVFQDILLNAWRSYDSFAGASAFSTWLYKVALNTALFRLRARRVARRKLDALPEAGTSVVSTEARDDAVLGLRSAIGVLDDLEKSVILLHLEAKSYREIAEITGLTEGHVGVKLNRIKQKLKARMAPQEESDGD